MHKFLIDWLICPTCRSELAWDSQERTQEDIQQAVATCKNCGEMFSIQEGIGIFLASHLLRADLWQQADSELKRYLNEHLQVKRELLQTPLKHLSPADQFFRHMILEEEGFYEQSQEAEKAALRGMYTNEYMQAWQAQLEYVVEACSRHSGAIIDLASGRGYLAQRLLETGNPIVVTDFSVDVLRKNRMRMDHFGLSKQLSFLAVDARRTPFRDGVVPLLTTNVGLPNIEQADDLLAELRRICGGEFLAIHHFFPRDDSIHQQVFAEMGNAVVHDEDALLAEFVNKHWKVTLENPLSALAKPTPKSVLLEGAEIDRIPLADVILKWCTLRAS